MEKYYWILFVLGISGIILLFLLMIVCIILEKKKKISRKFLFISLIFSFIGFVLSLYVFIPCIKDYKFVVNDNYFEEDAVVVEFTKTKRDLDGNGQTNCSEPKLYIENKNEYIILYTSSVEIGKKYRIKYLPNTKLCDIMYCIE